METNERFARIAAASPDVLKKIDDILEGKVPFSLDLSQECRLVTIAEACRLLGMKYATFHRAMQDGCFDVVPATGKNLIKESSVREFAQGKRGPSAEGLARRAERNRLRRLARRSARQPSQKSSQANLEH